MLRLHHEEILVGRQGNAPCSLHCKDVVFVRGNHEDENWPEFAKSWHRSTRPLTTLHGEVFKTGPLVIVGFPCLLGSEEFLIAPREPLPANPEEWLLSHMKEYGESAQILWLMHEPPRGTILSQDSGPTAGNQEWTAAIKRFAPWVVIFGHDHHTPLENKRWYCEVGSTTCVNVGQTDQEKLHYSVIKAKFTDAPPILPSEVSITA